MLETGGHRPIDRVPVGVVKIVDVKCPGSGEAARNEWRNLDWLSPHDQVSSSSRTGPITSSHAKSPTVTTSRRGDAMPC